MTLENGQTFALGRPLGRFAHCSECRPFYQFVGAQTARF
jgi:hypothetical protein